MVRRACALEGYSWTSVYAEVIVGLVHRCCRSDLRKSMGWDNRESNWDWSSGEREPDMQLVSVLENQKKGRECAFTVYEGHSGH